MCGARLFRLPVLLLAVLPLCGGGVRLRSKPPDAAPVPVHAPAGSLPSAVALAHSGSRGGLNTSLNATSRQLPSLQENRVGRAWALYYDGYSHTAWSVVEATPPAASYAAASDRLKRPSTLQEQDPSCKLQLTSTLKYSLQRDDTKELMWLATKAVCDFLAWSAHAKVPDCNAAEGQVCELSLKVPFIPEHERLQTVAGPAVVLATLSWLCAERSAYGACEVFMVQSNAASVIYAGLALRGGQVVLDGLGSAQLLDLKMNDAYMANIHSVYLATGDESPYQASEFWSDRRNVTAWQHQPPQALFCESVCCLVHSFFSPANSNLWC